MKDREQLIKQDMDYCQHYGRGSGADMACAKGMDLKATQGVAVGEKGIKWGPCIQGHMLPNPHVHCPHWIRRTREMGEKRADALEAAMNRMTLVMPVVAKWRTWKDSNRVAKAEVIECPVCKGKLHLSQAAYNGHVHGKCETAGCVAWME